MSAVLTYRTLPQNAGSIAVLSIDRPEAANAFDAAVITALTKGLLAVTEQAKSQPGSVRALVLRGQGKHFSAGADLNWMRAAAKLSYADNLRDAGTLTTLFESLANLPIPSLALVQGSAFGGAVGLAAAADIVIAEKTAKFALSEVRLGLLPAVILPYLARRLTPQSLRRLALSGRVFTADEAMAAGLVSVLVDAGGLEAAARTELEQLLGGAPEAQAELKSLLSHLAGTGNAQGARTAEAISKLRAGPVGQAGLQAFFEKKPAPWAGINLSGWQLHAE